MTSLIPRKILWKVPPLKYYFRTPETTWLAPPLFVKSWLRGFCRIEVPLNRGLLGQIPLLIYRRYLDRCDCILSSAFARSVLFRTIMWKLPFLYDWWPAIGPVHWTSCDNLPMRNSIGALLLPLLEIVLPFLQFPQQYDLRRLQDAYVDNLCITFWPSLIIMYFNSRQRKNFTGLNIATSYMKLCYSFWLRPSKQDIRPD